MLFKNILKTSLIILKLVIPFYIIADILIYFGVIQKISFIFEPITSLIGLSPELSLSLAAGILLQLYPAIAFAAPLNLSPYEWTVLGLFLGVAHSLPVENAIMKKLGFSYLYSSVLRISVAFIAVWIFQLLPFSIKGKGIQKEITLPHYQSFCDMITTSFQNASVLAIKIILLISLVIIIMEIIKNTVFKNKNLNASFSLITGLLLGITYGAGILIKEKESLNKKELFFIGTFLMIAHSLIEDPLLFVIFGANIWILIGIRVILAIIISFLLTKLIIK